MLGFSLSSQPKFATNIAFLVYFPLFPAPLSAYCYPTKTASVIVAPRPILTISLSFQFLISNKRSPSLPLPLFLILTLQCWLSYRAPDWCLLQILHFLMSVFLLSSQPKFATNIAHLVYFPLFSVLFLPTATLPSLSLSLLLPDLSQLKVSHSNVYFPTRGRPVWFYHCSLTCLFKCWLSYQTPDPSLLPLLHLSMLVFLPSPWPKFATNIVLYFFLVSTPPSVYCYPIQFASAVAALRPISLISLSF